MTDHDNTYALFVEEETLIADATELICQVMRADGVSRQELALRLGKTKGFVSQLLTGQRNMTLRTLADVLFALGHRFELAAKPLSAARSYPQIRSHVRPSAGRFVWSVPRPTSTGDSMRVAREQMDEKRRLIDTQWPLLFASLESRPEPGDPTSGSEAHNLHALLNATRRRDENARTARRDADDNTRTMYYPVAS